MPGPVPPSLTQKRAELLACRITSITHRDVDILVRMVAFGIVTHHDIAAWQVQPERNVIDVTLMVMPMPSLDRHRTVHDCGVKLEQLCDVVVSPRTHYL